VVVERLDKPVVVIVTAEFEAHGRRIAAHHGHPSMRMLVLPYPLEGLPEEELRRIAQDSYERLVRSLGTPV
jgi:hypothetical protein